MSCPPRSSTFSRRSTSTTWTRPTPRHQAWEEASRGKDLSDPRPYRPRERYTLDEVIAHPRFGLGIVRGVKQGDKIYVVFEDDTRVLAHGRK